MIMLRSKWIVLFVVAQLTMTGFARPAHAIDKRLKVAFKTAAYGAGAGFLIGAGAYALGVGDWKNLLMGASSGMYAGIAFAGYLILSQDEYQKEKQRARNPYRPRKPVGPDDWEEEEDGDDESLKKHLPPETSLRLESDTSRILGRVKPSIKRAEVAVWAPVFSIQF